MYHLQYYLDQGFIHNWLVAGPHATPVTDLDRYQGQDLKPEIARRYHKKLSEILEPPIENGIVQVGNSEVAWHGYRCLDDHLVDLSTFYHTPHHLKSWAYSEINAPGEIDVHLVLTTNGPADMWINRERVHHQEHFHHQDPHSVHFQARLTGGWNEVLVRFEAVAVRECPYVMALQITDLDTLVRIPTDIEHTDSRLRFERAFEQAYTERDVSNRGKGIVLRWAEDLDTRMAYTCRLQDWRNRIYAEGSPPKGMGEPIDLSLAGQLEQGRYAVVVMPPAETYYVHKVRYQRRMPVHVLSTSFSTAPYGTFQDRRREALQYAAQRSSGLYSEIAKCALGRTATIDKDVVQETVRGINERADGSDLNLVGLLGMMHRYMASSLFPSQLKQPLQACVLGFKYWHDEPGPNGLGSPDAMCYTSESHSILFHTCEILAGQLYPDHLFSNAGQNGRWHREKGERLALEWLHTRGTTGFTEWDSNCYFEEDLLALSHLVDLAENVQVRELAAVVMDKMFFSIAVNSYKGVFGSTHGRTYAPMIKGGQMEPTSGITRLMWGMGVWNEHIRGIVGLAGSSYELPSIIETIAHDVTREVWNKEHSADALSARVNKVTYRTADYMLCSAQDYQPGEKGYQQHIWQATLGPDAVVFVTHPPCISENSARRPNFWHGNAVLPRVAQYKDVLVAVHSLPEDDWLGFTHAYWPVYALDEYAPVGGASGRQWAFARKGQGYLALAAAQGMELVTRGPSAYRELRSHGQHNVWLCMMGRQETDGSFDEFQDAVRSLHVDLREQGASCTTLRGDTLSFGWEGPFLVNGEEQPLSGFRHYDNPYCVTEVGAPQIDIGYGDTVMRLHFEGECPTLRGRSSAGE